MPGSSIRPAPARWLGIPIEQLPVLRLPLVQNCVQAEAIDHILPCALSNGAALFRRRLHHARHCFSQGGCISGGSEPAGFSIDDHLPRTGNIGCHSRQSAGRGFQKTHRQTFPAGRKHKSIRGLHPGQHIPAQSLSTGPCRSRPSSVDSRSRSFSSGPLPAITSRADSGTSTMALRSDG
jgi:hypothetical protein